MGPSLPCPTVHSTWLKLIGQGNRVGRIGVVGSLLGDSTVRHSMGRMWPLLQSHTTQSLLHFPTSASPGGVYHMFRLGITSCPHCMSKLRRMGPLGLGETDKAFHCEYHWLCHESEMNCTPSVSSVAILAQFWNRASEGDALQNQFSS